MYSFVVKCKKLFCVSHEQFFLVIDCIINVKNKVKKMTECAHWVNSGGGLAIAFWLD